MASQLVADVSHVVDPNVRNALDAFAIVDSGWPVVTTASNTSSFSATTAQVTGSPYMVVFNLTGTLAGAGNVTLPATSAWIAAMSTIPGVGVGESYLLRIYDSNAAAFQWTAVAGDGSTTFSGPATIGAATGGGWTEFNVKVATATTIVLTRLGAGTL